EEMDMKVLQFKNKKLCERLEQRQALEDELRERIEKLEKRQATDDTTLLIVNRYWGQNDELARAQESAHTCSLSLGVWSSEPRHRHTSGGIDTNNRLQEQRQLDDNVQFLLQRLDTETPPAPACASTLAPAPAPAPGLDSAPVPVLEEGQPEAEGSELQPQAPGEEQAEAAEPEQDGGESEAAQLAEDLKVQLEHTQAKLKEIQNSVSDNRSARERESFNLKRAQEDLSRLRRKLEKQKKVEVYTDADEILQEEINQYKAKLRCPCCNTRDKETVLTKCFHVFCYECLKTRYDTRQRKCPKCNAAFGANDFHRIYIN
uniref:E3 ubiquitin protein ligase n=1 Tax=Lepisosteus oculatus TaxID=7918 RepID=W5M680_LEPOC